MIPNFLSDFLLGLYIVLLSFGPAFIYLVILFLTTPYKSWNFGKAMAYVLAGVISIPFLLGLFNILPFWGSLSSYPDDPFYRLAVRSFIQVAFIEELSKYILFWLFRKKVLQILKNTHPLSVMIYAGAVSLGFACIENIQYGMNFGVDVIYTRSIFSVVIHMVCGMMMGYWIALSKYDYTITTNPTNRVNGLSIFDVVLKNKVKFRKAFYTTMGIFMAVFFHGLYDFNLMGIYPPPMVLENVNADPIWMLFESSRNISFTIIFIILAISLYLVKNMANHLIKLESKSINN